MDFSLNESLRTAILLVNLDKDERKKFISILVALHPFLTSLYDNPCLQNLAMDTFQIPRVS